MNFAHYFLLLKCLLLPITLPAKVPSDAPHLITKKQSSNDKPKIQLAAQFKESIHIKEYYVSEKLDGVRGYWDGTFLRSKRGYVINAPKWFTKDFGAQVLDGELWIGRGKFEQTLSTVSKLEAVDSEWRRVRFMIFDLPNSTASFQQRVKAMQAIVKNSKSRFLQLIPQKNIDNHIQLKALLEDVVNGGGEGLMLHRKAGYYQVGRSENILKLKVYEDAEAKVIAHIQGKGKFAGVLGSMLVETDNGIRFKIGSGFSMLQRQNPPEIGSIITYKYWGLTSKGTPRFASFLRRYHSF